MPRSRVRDRSRKGRTGPHRGREHAVDDRLVAQGVFAIEPPEHAQSDPRARGNRRPDRLYSQPQKEEVEFLMRLHGLGACLMNAELAEMFNQAMIMLNLIGDN